MLDGIAQGLKNMGFGAANRLVMAALVLAVGVCVIRILLALARRGLEATKLEKAAHTLVLSLAKVALYLLLAFAAFPAQDEVPLPVGAHRGWLAAAALGCCALA